MNLTNRNILNTILKKADNMPHPPALIGIYGSAVTGDEHEKSDLDLFILLPRDYANEISCCMILEDCDVGYDIYCTSEEHLRSDAECRHAKLAKLLDSEIVLVNDEAAYQTLLGLREKAKALLQSPKRFERATDLFTQAKLCYANACLRETLGEVRLEAFGAISLVADAFMLYHGCYFKRGTKRMLEELAALPIDPCALETMSAISRAQSVSELRELIKRLLLSAEALLHRPKEKAAPSKDLAGTYEEICSNWKNKVIMAAKEKDVFSSFMNMSSLQAMLNELADSFAIGKFEPLEAFDPHNLEGNAKVFEACLTQYESVYTAAGLTVRRYPDSDAFASAYLKT